jgi:hypothetical protein
MNFYIRCTFKWKFRVIGLTSFIESKKQLNVFHFYFNHWIYFKISLIKEVKFFINLFPTICDLNRQLVCALPCNCHKSCFGENPMLILLYIISQKTIQCKKSLNFLWIWIYKIYLQYEISHSFHTRIEKCNFTKSWANAIKHVVLVSMFFGFSWLHKKTVKTWLATLTR